MISTVKLVSSTICVMVKDKVKKLSGRRVRIIIALNDCGRFKSACVICSKSCMTLLISLLVE